VLVRARWDEAVSRGGARARHAGGTHLGAVLRRLGFEEVCRLRRLEDPT
jgi:hypothetical protein